MISPEAVLALKAYTTLGGSLQGVLERRSRGFEIGGDIRRDSAPILPVAPTVTVSCVRKATFHTGLMDPGTVKVGPFTFRGETRKAADGRVTLLGRMLESPDEAPAPGASASASVLVSFDPADVLRCAGKESVPFGTVSTMDALVPPWSYFVPVLSRTVPRLVSACPGGCFLIERLGSGPAPPGAQALLQNLSSLDIVVVVPPLTANSVLYRLATNSVLAGPPGYEDRLSEFQAALRVGTSAVAGARLPSTTELQVSASMADAGLMGEATAVTLQQVKDAAPAEAAVYFQPLIRWQLPARRLSLRILLSGAPGGSTQRLQVKPWVERTTHLAVDVKATVPAFAPPRPGESPSTQKEQLERVLRHIVGKRVLELAPGGGQAALDAFTAAVLRASDASINQTALFGIPISTRVQAEFVATSGQPVRLANGGIAVVPEYATASASPRMCAFLGGLVAAGLRVSYLPWSRARQGVPVF